MSFSFARNMQTVDITYAGQTIALPDLPEYAEVYARLAAGKWEPHTFATLRRCVNEETVVLDIGAWIGVTPFWTAQIAKQVIAVEPDPKCLEILRALAPGYPNVTLIEAALATGPEVQIHAKGWFGSSGTTVLSIANAASTTARGVTMDELLAQVEDRPLFAKIDIEGFEFVIPQEIGKLRQAALRGVQISLHPRLYEKSLRGPVILRRVRAIWDTWRLIAYLKSQLGIGMLVDGRSLFRYLSYDVLLGTRYRFAEMLFLLGRERSRPTGAP
jgi:FkbM family methyltransferase